MMEEISNQVMATFADFAAVPLETLSLESDLRSTGEIDSLSLGEFYATCEQEWQIEIPDRLCLEFKTIRDVVDHVERAIA